MNPDVKEQMLATAKAPGVTVTAVLGFLSISPLDAALQTLQCFMDGKPTASAYRESLWWAHDLFWEEGFPSPKDPTYRGAAVFSAGRTHRLLLARSWAPGPVMTLGALNPSSAGGHKDDNTVRRGVGFARREGCGGCVIVNTRGLIATNPVELKGYKDLPINGTFVEAALRHAALVKPRGPVVAAWGSNIERDDALARDFLDRAKGHGLEVLCFGTCVNGTPKHPLRLSKAAPLVRYG